jgi:hypothetical protein
VGATRSFAAPTYGGLPGSKLPEIFQWDRIPEFRRGRNLLRGAFRQELSFYDKNSRFSVET